MFKKRIQRIVGPVDQDSFHQIDPKHWIVKPNSFSQKGILIDDKVLRTISYGDVKSIPVSMTYALDQDQIGLVLNACVKDLRPIVELVRMKSYREAIRAAKQVCEELCLCLVSIKKPGDKTMGEIEKRLSIQNRSLYHKIVKVLNTVPKFDCKRYLAQHCIALFHYKGSYATPLLRDNHAALIADARSSFVPYMTNSSFEQDHYGLGRIHEDDLISPEYDNRVSAVDYSPVFMNGLKTLSDRVGTDIPMTGKKSIDPDKKKALFMKANKVMKYLEQNNDEVMLDTFKKIMGYLCLGNDHIKYDNLLVMPSNIEPAVPFVVPVIVEDAEDDIAPSIEYTPIEALEILNSNMTPQDFLGSINLSGDKQFPFGGLAPLDKPRRIRKEVR